MSTLGKLLDKILLARSDRNIRFDEIRRVLLALDFGERIRAIISSIQKMGLRKLSTFSLDRMEKRSHIRSDRSGN
jgi:hypothetical protein